MQGLTGASFERIVLVQVVHGVCMNHIEIDTRSQIPIYEQIMGRIRALVREGVLRPGSLLPSVRQLAADLEINPNTVARAYGLLEREGLLATARRRGTMIAPSAGDVARKTVGNWLDDAIDHFFETAASLGIDRNELVKALERRGRSRGIPSSKGSSR